MEAKPGHMSTYGQPVSAYGQPQVMGMPAHPIKPPVSKFWRIGRLVLLPLSLVFAVIVIGLLAAVASMGSGYAYDYVYPVIDFAMGGPAVVVAIIWDIAELIAICARRGHRGIHPGASVGMNLVIWLGLIAGTAMLVFETIWDSDNYGDNDYYYSYSGYSDEGWETDDLLSQIIPLEAAAAGIEGILMLIHFVLFVMACVETHKRNRGARQLDAQQVVVVMPPQQGPQPPVAPNGYYFVPITAPVAQQQQQPQQQQYMAMPTQPPPAMQTYPQQPQSFTSPSPSHAYSATPPQNPAHPQILQPSPVHASRLSSAAQSLQQPYEQSHTPGPLEMGPGYTSPPPQQLHQQSHAPHADHNLYS